MEIKIHVQNLHLSAEQEAEIEKKFEKLTAFAQRLSDEATTIRIDLIHEDTKKIEEAYGCNLTLFVPNDTLRAEARGATLENATDEVFEKIKTQIERYKDKMNHISERTK